MSKEIKEIVREKYNEIALERKKQKESSCCTGNSCCGEPGYTIFSDDYTGLQGYEPDADLGLGCGLPTEHAGIKRGHTVVDLGSGAGNDAFVARQVVGENGKVTGIDFAGEMLLKAHENAVKLGYTNVEFISGDIEDMPLEQNYADVAISNCVLNLVPDKKRAFSEIYRILKPGGHFCISDVVLSGDLPESLKQDAAMYAGCVSGALQKEEYLSIIHRAGFINVSLKKEKRIFIPDHILSLYLRPEEIISFNNSNSGIFSITVVGHKLENNGRRD